MAFSPNGKILATGYHAEGRGHVGIRLWSVETGEKIDSIPGTYPYDVQFFPDGNTLASVGPDKLSLWDTETLQERAHFEIDVDSEAMAVSPDGTKIVVGSGDGAIRVWEAADEEEVRNSGW